MVFPSRRSRRPPQPDRQDPTDEPLTAVAIDAPGVDEETVVPWSLLLDRAALRRRETLRPRSPPIAPDDPAMRPWLVRWVVLIGMFGATAFVVLTALAWSGPSLIAFRVLGATIGAATGPSSLALINRMFPAEDRARALGFWSIVVAAGPVCGLMVGGPLIGAFGWRAIFWFQAPVLAVIAVWSFLALPETPRLAHVHFDVPGQAALAVVIVGLLIGIDRALAWGLTNPWALGCWQLVPTALLIFVRIERRAPTRSFNSTGSPTRPSRCRWRAGSSCSSATWTGSLSPRSCSLRSGALSRHRGAHDDPTSAHLRHHRAARRVECGADLGAIHHGGRQALVEALTRRVRPRGRSSGHGSDRVGPGALGAGIGAAPPRLTACVANSVPFGDLGIAGATQWLVAQVGTTLG